MLTVLTCLTTEHDLRLVLLAALVCTVGTSITVQLLLRARAATGRQTFWPYLAGVTFGASIWSTHFIAMLAYDPSALLGYAPFPTILSLGVSMLISIGGFVASGVFQFRGGAALSGALVGLGVASMHYIGMHALDDVGILTWDGSFVAASIAVGATLGAVAMSLIRRRRAVLGAASLILAICGLHFTGMAALTIQPLAAAPASTPLVPNAVIALATAVATMLILATALAAFAIDQRTVKQSRKRLRTLADAAIEGLLIVENGRATDWNRSFEILSGLSPRSGDEILIDNLIQEVRPGDPQHPRAKHVLTHADGGVIPIELLTSVAAPGVRILAVRDLRDKIASENRIHYLAHNDPLTALPNRLALLDHFDRTLARAGTAGGKLAVLALDLDRFKEVNDVFGHAMGDRVLSAVAAEMHGALRDGEFLARIGGDEFVVVQHGARQPDGANDICERLIAAAMRKLDMDGNIIQLGVSIGVAIFPKDGATASELMANADLAMYRAKDSVSSDACFFESEMDDQVRLRRALARDLRQAISRDELELYYQVQTSIADSSVVGYEVLLRWRHPESGFIPPSQFIPIAEESGLILPIGEWVLETACRDAAQWPEPYRVAVNVSGVQFSQGDLPAVVLAALVKSGLDPKRLELEITETVLITDMDRALSILRRLKALGVSIAMDDFGTGYSSLSTLKAFPFDKIKIDRSFIDQVENQAQARSIVRAILALGRSLEIPVLAEGVETAEHLAFLREEGCDEAQGFLLGRPGPLASIAAGLPDHAGLVARQAAVA